MQLLYMSDHRPDGWLIAALREMGHAVEVGDWAAEIAVQAADSGYDLVLADVRRPDAAMVQDLAAATPLVVLADAAEAGERAAILRAGADACFVRPLHLIEVQARLMALARFCDRFRATRTDEAGLRLDARERRLLLSGRQAQLTSVEFRLAAYLLRREGQVVDLATLDRQLSGETPEPQPDRIRGLVSRLRAKLRRDLGAPLIHAVRGHGYVLRVEPRAAD
jgi:DNA-binding response OmpR family regulator